MDRNPINLTNDAHGLNINVHDNSTDPTLEPPPFPAYNRTVLALVSPPHHSTEEPRTANAAAPPATALALTAGRRQRRRRGKHAVNLLTEENTNLDVCRGGQKWGDWSHQMRTNAPSSIDRKEVARLPSQYMKKNADARETPLATTPTPSNIYFKGGN